VELLRITSKTNRIKEMYMNKNDVMIDTVEAIDTFIVVLAALEQQGVDEDVLRDLGKCFNRLLVIIGECNG